MRKTPGSDPDTLPHDYRLDAPTLHRLVQTTLREQLNLDQDILHAPLNRTITLEEQGQWRAALEVYAQVGLLDPALLAVQLGIARCATRLGEHAIALQAAAAAILLAPKDPRGYLLSGENCMHLGYIREARKDLEQAIRLSAKDAVLVAEAIRLLSQLGNDISS